ncbi:MAG: cytochrome c [Actinomycetota bacterium]
MSHTSRVVRGLLVALMLTGASCSGTGTAIDGSTGSVPQGVTQGDPLAGAPLYRGVCATCHGADLGGVNGLGRSLVPSSFIIDQSDEDLVAFIIEGREIDHPDNITGVAMLPRGGHPSLNDQDIANIVAYIKAQQ